MHPPPYGLWSPCLQRSLMSQGGWGRSLACCGFLHEPEEVAMQCPVCATGLHITERQGIEIDYCPQCRGVWLDRGELDKLIERSLTVPSAFGGRRHATERAEGLADRWRDDDERSRPHRRKSFLSELFDFD
jgi:uncharacterized protein